MGDTIRTSISRDEMIEFEPNQKHIWRMILSYLNIGEFSQMISVCKALFFLVKEDQKLWNLICKRESLDIVNYPDDFTSWKRLYLESLIGWDTSTFNERYRADSADKNTLEQCWIFLDGWYTVLTMNHLLEGVLYSFTVSQLKSLTLGVAIQKTICSGKYHFGVDRKRFGYSCFKDVSNPYVCSNDKGKILEGKRKFENNGTNYILVHKGSYNSREKSTATVSFFIKNENEEKQEYVFSFVNIELEAGEKLYGFISTYCKDTKVKMNNPSYNFDHRIIPSNLELVDPNI